ncbi:hypothetical protein EXIGLDRAFT_628211 [Exidia glandulosa HHB12029]|uniref:C2H2-type domain-containing protein n=1 Tax=Exidia glandulosa HHB12029 TaxID=1314781 RepID=A0A165C181_EXIGL|nr:hypothetical protein EXIGLDRAFT_628211 [Exidia glandulosa HHB12029]
MSEAKTGAYGNAASDGSHRRKWDTEAYREKAREKDREERERMQENEELMRKGKKPKKGGKKEDLPKPTETMKQREVDLELDKNLNKTIIVSNNSNRRSGAGQPGFYCEVCDRNCKDSTGYLDHLNSRFHLRKLGQTTRLERSTVEQVRDRIAMLREKTKDSSAAKSYDFAQRMKEIRDKENALREERKAEKLRAKEAARAELILDPAAKEQQDEMASLMGFAGFGTSKK